MLVSDIISLKLGHLSSFEMSKTRFFAGLVRASYLIKDNDTLGKKNSSQVVCLECRPTVIPFYLFIYYFFFFFTEDDVMEKRMIQLFFPNNFVCKQ